MPASAADCFGEASRWQAALAPHAGTFSCLAPGSRIGVVPEVAVRESGAPGSAMLVWQASEEGLRVRSETFPGFSETDVDILIAADDAALGALRAALDADLLASMRRLIREGQVLFFARKTRRVLEQAGYEELLDELGFAFMGACR